MRSAVASRQRAGAVPRAHQSAAQHKAKVCCSNVHRTQEARRLPTAVQLRTTGTAQHSAAQRTQHPDRPRCLPRKKGGSPTALLLCTMGVRSQGALRSSVTRKSTGMSLAVGICMQRRQC